MNRVVSAEATLTSAVVVEPAFPDRTWSIVDFGAMGDGVTLNTDAVQNANTACATAGGGRVVFPPGLWVTGPIELASRVRLHAEKGALISFSRDRTHYPLRFSYWEGETAVRCQPPISGTRLTDVAITGEGIFGGNGTGWRPVKKWKMTKNNWDALLSTGGVVDPVTDIWWPDKGAMQGECSVRELIQSGMETLSEFEPYRAYLRPVLLGLYDCTNVLLEGTTFQNSPSWNIHLLECEQVTLRDIIIEDTYCDGAERALELIGLPERPLRRIEFRQMTLFAKQGVQCMHAEDVSFEQTNIHVEAGETWSFEGCRRILRDDGDGHSSESGSMPIRVFLAGDSTMSEYDASLAPRAGWGQALGELLNDRAIIRNKAASGRSSKSFLAEGRLGLIKSALRPGDVLLVQFGHNDQKPDEERRTEPFGTYQENLRAYIEAARSKDAYPMLLTPVQRRSFDERGIHLDTHGDYSVAMRQLAGETGVPLVDLAASSKRLMEELGPERSKELYLWLEPGAHPNYPDGVQDDTHFSEAGAREIARLFVREIKEFGLLLSDIFP
ncbi:GDSL-type esterase/lipase family protein [Cohnella sp.]|uniref:GDSL-type esterase/lipase family protein n=1 Tax=Cohnella sp. TaxID=1883426 RepID=UPI003567728E